MENATDELKVGDRVRYIGLAVIQPPPGTEGVITGWRQTLGMPVSFVVEFPTGREICWAAELSRVEIERPEPTQAERIADRVAELQAKRRLNKAEREELAILTYSGLVPRRVAPSAEVPF